MGARAEAREEKLRRNGMSFNSILPSKLDIYETILYFSNAASQDDESSELAEVGGSAEGSAETNDLPSVTAKRAKKDLGDVDGNEIVLYQSMLETRIRSKANEILSATTIERRVEESAVKVSFNDKQKTFIAHVICPLCSKTTTLSFNQFLSPSLHNFKRHVALMHLKTEAEEKETDKQSSKGQKSKLQPTIADAFKKIDAKKSLPESLPQEVDLTGDEQNVSSSVDKVVDKGDGQ